MKKLTAAILCGASFLLGAMFAGEPALAAWPDHPVRMIVTFAPGGGTDVWGRKLCSLLSGELGQKITVNNMVGGGGGTGTAYAWNAPHDGYTWCSTNDSSLAVPVMSGMKETARNWEFFIAGGSPGVLCVNPASGISSLEQFLATAREKPKSIKLAVSANSVWFLQGVILSNKCDVPVTLVTIAGTQPALVACASGEANAVIASLGEVASFVEAGKLSPIAMMGEKAGALGKLSIPAITSLVPAYTQYAALKQILGIQIPADSPAEAKEAMARAFAKIMAGEDMEKFRDMQHAELMNLTGGEAAKYIQEAESLTSWLLWELKLAKHDPASLGIPKP